MVQQKGSYVSFLKTAFAYRIGIWKKKTEAIIENKVKMDCLIEMPSNISYVILDI